MVSWWLLSQETGGVYCPNQLNPSSLFWGLETYHVGTFGCLASHAASSSYSYIYSAPWLHLCQKQAPFFGEFSTGKIPPKRFKVGIFCEFSTADPNCWDPVSFFFFQKLVSNFFPHPINLSQNKVSQQNLGLEKRSEHLLSLPLPIYEVRASKAWYFETQISFSLRVSQDVKMQVFVVGKLRELELVYNGLRFLSQWGFGLKILLDEEMIFCWNKKGCVYFRKLFWFGLVSCCCQRWLCKACLGLPKKQPNRPWVQTILTFYSFFIFQGAGMPISNSGGISWLLVMESNEENWFFQHVFQSKANRGSLGRLHEKKNLIRLQRKGSGLRSW